MTRDLKVRKERSRRYGDHTEGCTNLGMIWTGILQLYYGIKLDHPIPANIVELMMSGSKLGRAALDPSGKDHYTDGRVYLSLAEESAERTIKGGVKLKKEVA